MLFHTPGFAVFLAVLLLLCLLVRRSNPRKALLLIASYLFYMFWNPAFVLLILLVTGIDYLTGRYIYSEQDRARRRLWLILSLVTNIGLLGFFKYAGFLSGSLLWGLRALGLEVDWQIWQLTLPVGISFYTFQSMSYTIDVYRRRIRPAQSPLDFALFVAFFPHEVAGPIVRASEFLPQLLRPISISLEPAALVQISGGLVKKVLVADRLSPYVSAVFDAPQDFPSLAIMLACLAFSAQLYCDFSGYSDIAIGIARIFGLRFPQNFDRPYFAANPAAFWQRWHMTLSRWFRDYLALPLLGGHREEWRKSLSLFVTMLVCGLWHGAAWHFVLWGAMHGLMLVAHRLLAIRARPGSPLAGLLASRPLRFASWLAFFYFLQLSGVLFRSLDTERLLIALRKFIVFDGQLRLATPPELSLISILSVLLIFWLLHFVHYLYDFKARFFARSLGHAFAFAGLCTLLLCMFWPGESAPFIYFQF